MSYIELNGEFNGYERFFSLTTSDRTSTYDVSPGRTVDDSYVAAMGDFLQDPGLPSKGCTVPEAIAVLKICDDARKVHCGV